MSDRGSGLEPGGSRVQAGGGAGLTEDRLIGRRRPTPSLFKSLGAFASDMVAIPIQSATVREIVRSWAHDECDGEQQAGIQAPASVGVPIALKPDVEQLAADLHADPLARSEADERANLP